jgi:RNA polymerase sigma factor (sigma-70 family)
MKGVLRHLRRTERRRLYDLLADAELLARFLETRDESAFEELVCRHGPMVRAVCRRVLGSTADADDAFQAAFLVLLRKARSIRRTDLLANWLCAVAYRTARQALRRRYRRGAFERTGDELPEPARTDDAPRDWLPLFDSALQRLPAKYREPVVLCELRGLSRPEAARHLGLNEGTLSSRLGRARDLLRRELGPHGFPLAVGTALAPAIVPEALTASTAAAALNVSAASVSAIVLTEGVLTAMFASKLKAGAACTAVLLAGAVAGLQFTGPATMAGGPPDKDRPAARETPSSVAAADPPRRSAEFEPLQGAWTVYYAQRDGADMALEAANLDRSWVFDGNRLTTGGEAKDDTGAVFKLDSRAKPPAIDFTLTQFHPNGTGELIRTDYLGVYRFETDGALLISFRKKADGAIRPTRFATAHNSGMMLVALRRNVPTPPAKSLPPDPILPTVIPPEEASTRATGSPPFPPKIVLDKSRAMTAKDADLATVIGAWELTAVDGQPVTAAAKDLDRDANGNPVPAGRPRQRWETMRRLFLLPSGPTTLAYKSNIPLCLAYVDLDGTKAPKWITLLATNQELTNETKKARLCGIYKLEGEQLVLCLPEAETSPLLRPTEFKGDGEGGLYVLTFQRASEPWRPDPQPAPPVLIPAADLPPPNVSVANQVPTGPLPPPVVDRPPQSEVPSLPAPVVSAAADAFVPPVSTPTPPSSPPTPSDLDRLQGTWAPVQIDGKPIGPDANLESRSIEILKDRLLGSDGKHGRLHLDETKSPRRIGFEMPGQGSRGMSGIYKLEGDRLTIASYARSGKLIPVGFEPDGENGISVIVYERFKGDRPPPAPPSRDLPRIPESAPPRPAPTVERDLQKEVDQLREQLKRLEKLLKEQKPGPPGPAN